MKGFAATRIAVAVIFAATTAGTMQAQELPEASKLVARYQELSGAKAYAAKKSMSGTGEFSMPAVGIAGALEVHSARPNRTIVRITVAGVGEIVQGYTGEAGWGTDPMQGPRLMVGEEAKQAADDADFESHLRTPALIAEMKTVEKIALGGAECYKVKVMWKSGRESFDCYDVNSGLLIGSIGRQETAMGPTDVTTLYGDYKEFDGITVPTRLVTQLMGMEQIMVLKEVKFDSVPESAFEVPASIKALIKK